MGFPYEFEEISFFSLAGRRLHWQAWPVDLKDNNPSDTRRD